MKSDARQADTPWPLLSRMAFGELAAMPEPLLWLCGLWREEPEPKPPRAWVIQQLRRARRSDFVPMIDLPIRLDNAAARARRRRALR